MSPEVAAFWGARTASVDWCETNYQYSPYVCELFNTLSSFAMVLAGVVGAAMHRKMAERRFTAAFAALGVVGVGSAAFHATLRFELQMLDELPMLYLALVMVFVLVEMRPLKRFGRWFPLALMAYAGVGTALSMSTRGSMQFWAFQTTFGSLELFCLVRVWILSRASPAATTRRLFWIGMGCYVTAIAAWFVDARFCTLVSTTLPAHGLFNPQLHAVWHVLVSLGFYFLLVLLACERMRLLGVPAEVAYWGGFLPYVATASHVPQPDRKRTEMEREYVRTR